jgi:hypothetical protein
VVILAAEMKSYNINRTAVAPLLLPVKVRVEAKLSLCLTKYYIMKTYWGVEV